MSERKMCDCTDCQIEDLTDENILMNELVSDLKRQLDTEANRLRSYVRDRDKTIESLRGEVNRLSRALVDRGLSVTEVRNIASG